MFITGKLIRDDKVKKKSHALIEPRRCNVSHIALKINNNTFPSKRT